MYLNTLYDLFNIHRRRLQAQTFLQCKQYKLNFLGLQLDSQMTWQAHINALAGKINRSLGILNRLKHYLPLNIKKLMYNSLVLSHLNYGILLWGFTGERIFTLQ